MIGKASGHHQIVEQFGRRGMGKAYRADDPRVGLDVAIKVSSEQFTDSLLAPALPGFAAQDKSWALGRR